MKSLTTLTALGLILLGAIVAVRSEAETSEPTPDGPAAVEQSLESEVDTAAGDDSQLRQEQPVSEAELLQGEDSRPAIYYGVDVDERRLERISVIC